MVRARPHVAFGVIAIGGGLLFVASLLYFLAQYAWRFGETPEPGAPLGAAIAIDLGLFSVFALHHSVFARAGIKAWIARVAPPALERSIYVWVASVLFAAVCALWQPVAGVAWHVPGAAATAALIGQLAGVALSVIAAGRLDALELAGVRQVLAGPSPPALPRLDTAGPFRLVRHPIYLGWLFIVWLAPAMTGTRLTFAAVSSLYLVIAIPFEERALRRTFGARYDAYARHVRWRMLPGLY
jgi:protein-S-isoprenylcysteine O-methyltransferase Ste14